ncbi:proline-rich protein 35 [Hemicordylus capensis]|uniref:proline-rich protein 35 n=1 Tax=Hemicordylus capensis TaxID=884348 RepID=UPI0023029481|nr:proline-rich protein 35 [Hemicordylus capensis]
MSKDEAGCKLASVYKHKERKPKKPHYIPRPWGKPYNYKCFQCPFTCMEKSHLYNHMKYSLCKNSLSLLIESDWPYKKGNLLHPELRLLHATEASRARGRRDEPETYDSVAVAAGTPNPKQCLDRDSGGEKPAGTEDSASERMSEETSQFQEEEEEEEEELSELLQEVDPGEKKDKAKEASAGGETAESDMNALLLRFKNKREKPCKDPAPDFIITDVFSLKNHVVKGKEPASLELESKPKPCKVPKKCPGGGGVLMEQWKLVANGQRRGVNEVPAPCPDGNIIPCYPPPAYGEYHEPQSLNLSLLGINYPLSPNLFSYLSPSVASSATPQPHLAQLPFLASTAQLMHPHSAHFQPLQSPDRSAFLPRFYYPLLFEHSFSSAESKMAATKPESQPQAGSAVPAPPQAKAPTEPPKAGLLKVPVMKAGLPWVKGFREEPPLEPTHKMLLLQEEEEKWVVHEKDSSSLLGVSSLCRKTAPNDAYRGIVGMKDGGALLPNSNRKAELPIATCLDSSGTPVNSLKRKLAGNGLELVGSDILAPGKLLTQEGREREGRGRKTKGKSEWRREKKKGREERKKESLRSPPTQLSKSLDHWHMELHDGPAEDQEKTSGSDLLPPAITASHHQIFKPSHERAATIDARDPEATTVLIGDLSKTLEEYQEVEKKLSGLAKENTPAQQQLREQLVKIRRELFHIHQALEKASKPSEGPLDLSVKRPSKSLEIGHQDKTEPKAGVLSGKLQGKDPGSITRCSVAGEAGEEDKMPNCLLEAENKTIDLLIKMSRSEDLRASSEAHLGAVIKAEVLPLSVPLELRHVMDPFYSRTTKCEADSSVLLCTDGRSNIGQGPQLSASEDIPLGCRPIPRSLSCGLPSEMDGVCIHSPLNTEP